MVFKDNKFWGWRTLVVFLVFGVVAPLVTTSPVEAVPVSPEHSAEQEFLGLLNRDRLAAGLPGLVFHEGAATQARNWSAHMADNLGYLEHTTTLSQDTAKIAPQWRRAGENIGRGATPGSLHVAFMNSPGHKRNVLGEFNQVGIGVVYRGSTLWVTFRFIQNGDPTPTAPQSTFNAIQAEMVWLYQAFFNRAPDTNGLAYWVQARLNGLSPQKIADLFAESAEFKSDYRNTSNDAYVTRIYNNILGRDPDPGGKAHWLKSLNAGYSRSWLVYQFSIAPEFRNLKPLN